MTIHINIGEVKTRLSELVAAARRGEDVVIAHAGKPAVKLVPVSPEDDWAAIIARRRAFFGSVKSVGTESIDWSEPSFTNEELDSFEKPF